MAFESKYINPVANQQNCLHIKTDYSFEMSNHDEAVIRFAKMKLDNLYKRILRSNNKRRRKVVTENEITEIYQDALFNVIPMHSSSTGSVRQQIEHVHTTEVYKLIEAIRRAKRFTDV